MLLLSNLKLLAVIIPTVISDAAIPAWNIELPSTKSAVLPYPGPPKCRLNLGMVVPTPTFVKSLLYIPVPRPDPTCAQPVADAFRFVKLFPSPWNCEAVMTPTLAFPVNSVSPITRSLLLLAVVPIPTPSSLTSNMADPEITLRAESPKDVVPIPTSSNRYWSASLEILTLPNLLHSFAVV